MNNSKIELSLTPKLTLGQLIENFNSTFDIWINELESYTFSSLCAKPSSESWSLGQVFAHIIEETKFYFQQIEFCIAQNANSSQCMTENASYIFLNNDFPNERFKGDVHISDHALQPLSKAQLYKDITELKLEMNLIGSRIINSQPIGKTKHPGMGYLNAKEWFQYAEMHFRHHFRQKNRIDDFLKNNK